MSKTYYVYILTNASGTLYIGVTNSLVKRVWEHKNKVVKGFTEKYNISKLIYYETTTDIEQAIIREKQLKNWNRKKKLDLIRKMNPSFEELTVTD
jgi:putative endonuclease